MNNVELYTKPACGYCVKAKQLLDMAKIPYTEHKLDVDFTREMLLEKYPAARTYPVVVLDNYFIGGANDLEILLQEAQHWMAPNGKYLTE